MNNPYRFGSTLEVEYQLYVRRKADIELENELKEGNLCCLFNARKQGKSSLIMRTVRHFRHTHQCIYYEFLDKELTEKKFFKELLTEIIGQLQEPLGLDFKDHQQWKARCSEEISNETIIQNLFQFISNNYSQPIIIFFDEIDRAKNYKFSTDSFFSLIRSIVNNKTKRNIFNFCLVGAAKVADLIENKQSSPFNLGKAIELTGFKLGENEEITDELKVLITDELKAKVENPNNVLREVIKRTGGQPFLTQKLLYLIVEHTTEKIAENSEYSAIIHLEEEHITKNWRHKDNPEHFKTIENRIIKYQSGQDELEDDRQKVMLLNMYKKVLESKAKEIQEDDLSEEERSLIEDLKLSGLIVDSNGIIKSYCPIYQKIFNQTWIDDCLKKNIPSWYREKQAGWEKSNPENEQNRDKYYLLYGEELRVAKEREKIFKTIDDGLFLMESEYIYRNNKYDKITKINNGSQTWYDALHSEEKDKIVDRLRYWTNYETNIFDKIIEIINKNIDKPDNLKPYQHNSNNEETWVDNLIQTHITITEKSESIDILKKIDQQIISQKLSEDKGFNLLVTYGEILHTGKIKFSEDNEEQKNLINIGLVKRRYNLDDQGFTDLKVVNPICETIFNLDYIHQNLPEVINGRSYGKKFGMWLITRENQHLLNQEEFNNDNVKKFLHQIKDELEHEFILRSQLRNPLKIDSQ